MPTHFQPKLCSTVLLLLVLAIYSSGCSAPKEGCHQDHGKKQQLAANADHQSSDRKLQAAEQQLAEIELRIGETFKKITSFLENNPIPEPSTAPSDETLRLRQLIIMAERINESLSSLKATHRELSDRLAVGKELTEIEAAKLEQTELGEQILQGELEKVNKQIEKLAKSRKKYVKLMQEYQSLAKELKLAEQERHTVMSEIMMLRETENHAENKP
ncbi:MAG: hypothetical protein AB8C95_05455 [Phycisphaeraceae bacterium]